MPTRYIVRSRKKPAAKKSASLPPRSKVSRAAGDRARQKSAAMKNPAPRALASGDTGNPTIDDMRDRYKLAHTLAADRALRRTTSPEARAALEDMKRRCETKGTDQ